MLSLVNIFCFLYLVSIDFSTQSFSLQPYSVISDTDVVNENSALALSNKYKILWTLNDSGADAIIYPIDFNGKIIKPSWVKKYHGIKIKDAVNIDWEALTIDDEDNILISDIGNNYNYRKDLAIYKIAEPNPYLTNETTIIAKYIVRYPDQKDFPPDENNFNYDAEAMVYYDGKIFIIAKTRSTTKANIYVFENLKPWEINIGKIYKSFDFKSMVTDADISPDKKYLLVLTYNYIWLFEIKNNELISDKYYYKEISLGQCEGVSFVNKDEFVVSNEEGYLFKFNINDVIK